MGATEDLFTTYVQEAIDHIPAQYQEKMKHVAILVDEVPTAQQRRQLGLRSCDALFGLYEGIPLPQRGGNTLQVPPDIITIFKHPMLEIYTDTVSLKKQIYETLWHEVAHFFGLNHQHIHAAKVHKSPKP